ncbi:MULTISPECIES: phytoene desaturase family protein [Sphingobacterium]|uniref:NAD(P)/FAD-dependent oxidoreductase n=1 Tax=Sphingobacterium hotanense TaxID=649196 RepID=A0ABT7NK72_9SPHI|nr:MULTISPECIES: FAD-dependent oxidoreductase [Sphingobacterium]MDM1047625.1 NAD(P)/FAD-dependent oxidoreductase [Sphingobacterium hotanense]
MKETRRFDVVVMGSGLGGLVTGLLLAKAGKKVCILEKNNQYGGNLQTFVRDREIFDSGVHYIGSLAEDENLGQYWKYLGVLDQIQFERMDLNQFDVIRFKDDPTAYPQAQGYENFILQLSNHFPEEEKAIRNYIETVKRYCAQFPLYELKEGFGYDEDVMRDSCLDIISSLTQNEKLQAVLLGNGFLYGLHADSPFYMHALIVKSYIQSAWRCIRGGSQISKAFTKQLRLHGAKLYTYQEVEALNFDGDKIKSCETKDFIYEAETFVSNLSVLKLFKLFDDYNYQKPYIKRLESLKEGPSAFSTHIVLKENTVPYFNHNIYHFDEPADALSYEDNWNGDRPKSVMISCTPQHANPKYASSISVLTYMDFKQVEQWEDTRNTVAEPLHRGNSYDEFKNRISKEMIDILSLYFFEIQKNIKSIYTSTPLTYRDYIGTRRGAMYGIEKHASNPLASMISPKTKVKNLYLTGQDVRLHGILGVTISGFMAAGEILGREEFFDRFLKSVRNV